MILDEDTTRALQNWLVKNLEPICAAEPPVLATYILALLKNDKSVEDIRSLCIEELEDFLHAETQGFVNKLFSNLKDDGKGKITFVDSTPSVPEEASTTITHTPPSPTKEDREYRDESDSEDRDLDHKRARRSPSEDSDSRTREDSYESRKRRNRDDDDRYAKRERYSYDDSRNSRRRYNDRRYRDDDRRDDDDKGRYNKGRYDRPKRRCRDYDEKGVCMKGELCPYQHGPDSIVVTDVHRLGGSRDTDYKRKRYEDSYDPDKPLLYNNNLSKVNPLALPSIPLLDVATGLPNLIGNIPIPAYNPDLDRTGLDSNGLNENIIQVGGRGMQRNSDYDSKSNDSGNNNNFNRSRSRKDYRDRDRDSYRDRDNYRERDSYRDRNKEDYADRSAPPPTAQANTLMITSIPDDLNNIEKLNAHFKEFGSVVNIQVKARGKAFVQFASHEEATKALNSPQAVFGNRFIKVLWAKRQFSQPPKQEPAQPQEPPKIPQSVLEQREKEKEKLKAQIQLKELQKKKDEARKTQLEQTKQLLESLSKMKNVDPEQKTQLLKKIQSLTENVAESIAKDSTKLTEKASKAKTVQQIKQEKDKQVLDRELDVLSQVAEKTQTPEAETAATDPAAATDPNIQRLQKRYASLQSMAASMGIETSPAKRGRPTRGRGGASIRGRKRATMALDNRPTTLKVSDLPEDLRDSDVLSKHFGSFGEVTNLSLNGSQAVVQFANRRAAEMAFTKGRSLNNQNLQVRWNVPPKPATQPTQVKKVLLSELTEQSESTEEVVEEVYQQPSTTEDEQQYNEYDDEEDQEDDDERSWKH